MDNLPPQELAVYSLRTLCFEARIFPAEKLLNNNSKQCNLCLGGTGVTASFTDGYRFVFDDMRTRSYVTVVRVRSEGCC